MKQATVAEFILEYLEAVKANQNIKTFENDRRIVNRLTKVRVLMTDLVDAEVREYVAEKCSVGCPRIKRRLNTVLKKMHRVFHEKYEDGPVYVFARKNVMPINIVEVNDDPPPVDTKPEPVQESLLNTEPELKFMSPAALSEAILRTHKLLQSKIAKENADVAERYTAHLDRLLAIEIEMAVLR